MNERWLLLRKAWSHGTQIASIADSSRALATALCRPIDPSRPQVVVELGAGTGAVTAVAAERLHPASRLVAIELHADLAQVAARRAPRAEVVVGDVADVRALLASRQVGAVDVVVSGLPIPSLPAEVVAGVFAWLADQPATFHQLTVMPWVYRGLYRRWFEQVDFELVLWNLPPGGVYHCAGLRRPVRSAEER